jgi:adenylate cyclase
VVLVAYMSSVEKRMRLFLMNLYSRQVSGKLAESIWEERDSYLDGNRPKAQKIYVTVLFSDLKGFTPISEKLDTAGLFDWLNEYLGEMSLLVLKHGGILKQFTGDGMLAIFGAPAPHESMEGRAQDAREAVNCALAVGERLIELNRRWQAAGQPAVSMRVGIYSGLVTAGSLGSSDRFEYAVIGDVVNTASRLESYDKTVSDPDLLPNRCRILIGGPTMKLIGNDYVMNEIGWLEVKGKANKVQVFQVLGTTQNHSNPNQKT